MKKIFVTLLVLSLLNGCTMKMNVNNSPVSNFDPDKYLGKWYEIARFQHAFERDLVGVTATYSKREDGKITVLNEGYKDSLDGKLKQAKGIAKIPDSSQPSHLKVSFFWIFYADYFVMELDQENYSWALVGSSTEDYLWILSRTPQMEDDIYQMLVRRARERGYDISKLFIVPQKI